MSEEEEQMMVKGCEVEVSSLEEGFKGAYFRAVLEENLPKSDHNKVSVRYTSLLSDDGSSPLTETVDYRLIRPVPPEEEYVSVVLEEGRVVDAYLRDGWWTGVVINKKLEDNDYLVYFDSPPDIIVFEKSKLRAHVDWIDSKWFRPDLKEVERSMFCPGTMVEVSSFIDKVEVAWFSAMLIKEIEEDGEKKFIVKDCNHEARPNTTVDPRRVRPKPPPFSVEVYNLLDCVEAFHGSVWRQGLVRGVLTGDSYMVCLKTTKEEHVFRHSCVRPLKVWEDGAWHNGPKEPKTVTPKRDRKNLKRSLNHDETFTKAEIVAATGELRNKKADAVMMNDETPGLITPQVTSIAKESASVVTPSPPVIAATPLKQTGTETEGHQSSEKTPEPRSKQNGFGNGSTRQKVKMPEEETSQGKSRKRKREEEEQQSEVSSSSVQSPAATTTTYVEETPAASLMALPFAKRSPFWKRHEATEGYKTVPQRPHFSPLLEAKDDDDHREWLAVGMMVTFYGLLEEVKALKLDDPISVFSSLRDSFVKLEKYGFEIDAPRSRISKMMSLKEEQAKKAEEKQCIEKKVGEEEKKSQELGEEMAELKRREAVAREEKEGADKRVVEMKASGERIQKEIGDVELEFLVTASAPW